MRNIFFKCEVGKSSMGMTTSHDASITNGAYKRVMLFQNGYDYTKRCTMKSYESTSLNIKWCDLMVSINFFQKRWPNVGKRHAKVYKEDPFNNKMNMQSTKYYANLQENELQSFNFHDVNEN